MHERVRIDARTGARGCGHPGEEERSFERFPAEFRAWARTVGRPTAPEAVAPTCPREAAFALASLAGRRGRIDIRYPPDGAVFALDPGAMAKPSIRVQVDVPAAVPQIRLLIDGHERVLRAPFQLDLPLVPGPHHLRAEAEGAASEVSFDVH